MIQEDDEEPTRPELSELDTVRLVSCIEVIKNVIGDNVTEAVMTNEIIKANFDAEVALNKILNPTTSTNLGLFIFFFLIRIIFITPLQHDYNNFKLNFQLVQIPINTQNINQVCKINLDYF